MAKQVSEILVRLGIQGAEGLDKLKSSFRELEKSLGPSAETIERARKGIVDVGKESRNTEQLIKGQIEALRGLQSQTERGSTAWAELADDIERFRQASRKTDGEIQVLRQSILSVASGTDQSQKSLREYIGDLSRLRSEATITGGTFQELSRDIAALTGRLQEAEQQTQKTGRAFGRVLGQALASTSAGLRRQLDGIRELINEQRGIVDSIDLLSKKERELADNQEKRAAAQERLNRALVQQRQLGYAESIRAGRETVRVGAAAFNDPGFLSFERIRQQYGDLPDTTAGLNQELSELSERLLNTTRGSNLYVETANRMAEIQRELRTELTGTASTLDQLARSQAAAERQMSKRAGIEAYYAPTSLLAPGVTGYRDPATGAMIAGGAGPARIGVQESAYPTPIGPQPFPEAGRRAQEQIQRSLDDVNRIYEDARVRRAEIQAKYDQIHIDKLLEGLELEGQVREKGFKDELAAFDRQLEARDRRRRRRLTTGQAVQSAGAIISGGIFGGPEGFVGGLGGFAAGLAIPGLGPVGGAFAGAAAGAQVGALRQQAGAVAEYTAQLNLAKTTLAQAATNQSEYNRLLQLARSVSNDYAVALRPSIEGLAQIAVAARANNLSFAETEAIYRGIVASGVAFGKSQQDLAALIQATTQVLSKGKVSAEEMSGQIGERLPGAVAKFAAATGRTLPELNKAFEQGEVTIADFVKFASDQFKEYDDIAQLIAEGPEKAGVRLQIALDNASENFGGFFQRTGAGLQDFLTNMVNWTNENSQQIKQFVTNWVNAGAEIVEVLSRVVSAFGRAAKRIYDFMQANPGVALGNWAGGQLARMAGITGKPGQDRFTVEDLFPEFKPTQFGGGGGAVVAGEDTLNKDSAKAARAAEKAAREAEKARQEMLRQLKAAQDLNFAEKNKLDLLRQEEPFAKAFTEFAVRRAEIQRKYNDLLNASKSAEERTQLEQARGAAYKQTSLTLQKEINQLTEKAAAPIVDTVDKIKERIAYDQEYAKLLKEGVTPELAQQLLEIKKAYDESVKALEPAVKAAEAAILKAEAEGASATEIKKYREELEKIQNLPGQKKQEGEAAAQEEADRKKRDKLAQEQAERLQNLYSDIVGTLEDGIVGSLMNGIDALISGAETLGNTLKNIASGILKDIGQILIRFAINTAMRGIFPGAFAAKGAYFSGGQANFAQNSIKPFAMGGIVTKPTFFKYADGGAGRFGLMGEAGPEAIMPLKRGPNGRLGVDASGIREAFVANRNALGNASGQSDSAFAENREALSTVSSLERERLVERVLSSGSGSTEIKYSRVGSGDLPFVTEEDMLQASRLAAQEGARLGQQRTLAALKNNPGTRRGVGI